MADELVRKRERLPGAALNSLCDRLLTMATTSPHLRGRFRVALLQHLHSSLMVAKLRDAILF